MGRGGTRITATATANEPRMSAETRGSLRGGVGLPAPGPEALGAAKGSLVRRGRKAWELGEPAAGARLAPPAEQLVVHPPKTSGPGAPSLARSRSIRAFPRSS